jgi:hypothetical protein
LKIILEFLQTGNSRQKEKKKLERSHMQDLILVTDGDGNRTIVFFCKALLSIFRVESVHQVGTNLILDIIIIYQYCIYRKVECREF